MTRRFLEYSPGQLFLRGILGITLYFWLYAIGVELTKSLPRERQYPRFLFQVLAGYPVVWLFGFFSLVFAGLGQSTLFIVLHVAAMASTFLLFALVSRTILHFETAHAAGSSTGIGLFFGFWYWPVGVWFIQPKMNQYARRLP